MRQVPRDPGLTARMFFTMFLLAALYLLFIWVRRPRLRLPDRRPGKFAQRPDQDQRLPIDPGPRTGAGTGKCDQRLPDHPLRPERRRDHHRAVLHPSLSQTPAGLPGRAGARDQPLTTVAIAQTAMPSLRPTNPRPSEVVALIPTLPGGMPSTTPIRCCIRST